MITARWHDKREEEKHFASLAPEQKEQIARLYDELSQIKRGDLIELKSGLLLMASGEVNHNSFSDSRGTIPVRESLQRERISELVITRDAEKTVAKIYRFDDHSWTEKVREWVRQK